MLQSRFITYLKIEKRRSGHTIRSYASDIAAFSAYATTQYGITDLTEITHEILRSWMVTLLDSGMKITSVKRKISALRSLYKYGIKIGLTDKNPTESIYTPVQPKRLPVFYQVDEMLLFFGQPESPGDFTEVRNRLVMELLYATGMRCAELTALKDTAVHFERREIKVTGKRNKERIIPVSDRIISHIKQYQKLRNEHIVPLNNKGFLIVSSKGNAAYPKMIYRIVHTLLSQVTTRDKRSPHKIRHTFATHMLNAGADLNTIKELLGHSSLEATQVYTHNSIDQLKSIYKQAHPKA
ncbi:MAG: integrase [Bacteroidia bacterium]|nr:integrase [Bacteroidia bacterium]